MTDQAQQPMDPPFATAPDVDILAELLDYTEGRIITHAEIAALIGAQYDTQRYWTVVTAWKRRMLNDHNIVVANIPKTGYQVLKPGQRVTAGANLRHQAVRRARLGQRIIRGTDTARLTAEQRAAWDHEARIGAAVIAIGRTTIRQITEAQKLTALAEKGTATAEAAK